MIILIFDLSGNLWIEYTDQVPAINQQVLIVGTFHNATDDQIAHIQAACDVRLSVLVVVLL